MASLSPGGWTAFSFIVLPWQDLSCDLQSDETGPSHCLAQLTEN